MTKKDLPSPELLRKLLRYEPNTGKLFWKERPVDMFKTERASNIWNARFPKTEAFTAKDTYGYKHGSIFGNLYRAHRVIWCIYHGNWPKDQIDHVNLIRCDNRIKNLKSVDQSQNMRNRPMRKDNKSGFNGVHWCERSNRWKSQIRLDGRVTSLGYFSIKEDAIDARIKAEVGQGYTERHGL